MKTRLGLGTTIRTKIRNFKVLNKWRKWVKCYALMSTLLFAIGLGLTVLFLIDDYSNSQQAYEGIEIDPDEEAQIWLNFTRLDQMKVYIPVEIENLDKFDTIRNVRVDMELIMEYVDSKSNSEAKITIYSTKKDDVKNTLPGETTEFSFSAKDGKDEDWDWDNIYEFQTHANPNRKISVLLDLSISLTSGYDTFWLIYEGVDLSAESIAQVPVESSAKTSAKANNREEEEKNAKGQVYASGFGINSNKLLLFVLYFGFILFSFGVKRSRNLPKGIKTRPIKRNKGEVLKALVRALSFTVFFIVWDCIILFQLQNESLREVAAQEYVKNYVFSLTLSIIVSIIIGFFVILPLLFSKKFRQYSPSSCFLSVVIKTLIFLQIYIYFFLTSYLTIEFKEATLIIDTRASYLPFLILIIIQVILTIINFVIILTKKVNFEQIRREQISTKKKLRLKGKGKSKNKQAKTISFEPLINSNKKILDVEEIRDETGEINLDLMVATASGSLDLKFCPKCNALTGITKNLKCSKCGTNLIE